MGHHHHHGKNLFWAIVVNVLLTVVQIIGGLVSGSLSLIADALHNFSDAGSLIIAYIAERVSGLPANKEMTFGYGRAQIIGALINSVTLVLVGLYLLYEAWQRYSIPTQIDGWLVIWVAGLALIVDSITAWLTYQGAQDSINMRAAFIHNLSDAMASIVVIISGILILIFNIQWVDVFATVLISIYVLYQSVGLIKSTIKILMQGAPEDVSRPEVVKQLKAISGVMDVHHIHIWSIHEKFRSLEAHIVVDSDDIKKSEQLKKEIKAFLQKTFRINHSTLEIEFLVKSCNTSSD